MQYFVYILYSPSINLFYKGHTSNIKARIIRHNIGKGKFTKKGIPWILLWTTGKTNKSDAFSLERKLKNLTRLRLIKFMQKHKDGIINVEGRSLLDKLS